MSARALAALAALASLGAPACDGRRTPPRGPARDAAPPPPPAARADASIVAAAPAPPSGPEAERVLAALRERAPHAVLARAATEYDLAPDAGEPVRCFVARNAAAADGAAAGPTLACARGAEVLAGAAGFARYLALRGFRADAPFAPPDRLMTLADRFEGIAGWRYVDVGARPDGDALAVDGRATVTANGAPPAEHWFVARITRDGARTVALRPPPLTR